MRNSWNYRRGRKAGFSFGVEVADQPLRVRKSQKERAAQMAVDGLLTGDEILRRAIDRGLALLEGERAALVGGTVTTNPADW